MEAEHKLLWQLYFEQSLVEGVTRNGHNPIWDYEDELIDGPIIDIGCGQSDILLGFAATDRQLFALDMEPLQLSWLKQLAENQPDSKLENWHFLLASFPTSPLPAHKYALVCLSNFLHFYPLAETVAHIISLTPYLTSGTLLYVHVHSHRHLHNNPDDPNSHDYFKHYFAIQDFAQLFPHENFEQLYLAEVNSAYTKKDNTFTRRWVEKYFQQSKHTAEEIEQAVQEQLTASSHAHITALFRVR